jgi:LytS/YehU family sensor histidine kinase
VIEGDGKTVLIPRDVAQDPEKFAEAIDHARDQIEAIVQDQISSQVSREVRRYRAKGGTDWLMGFVTLLIVTGIIVKVVLGGKKKAERRAQAATATAAEESLKRQLVEAQLKMMQAQVEPHFLFNTLASVDYLIETDPRTASKMQKNLIQYLRAALPQMREGSTTLGKEVQLCRAFLEILKFRMEDRLQYTVIVPQGLQSAQFPPMMLQSLVENSIKHGLEPKPEGGSLTISADIANGKLRVTVADTGLGFAVAGQPGTGVGLANVRERLAALYGGNARLSIESNSPAGTIVTIEVPYSFEADAPEPNGVPQPA